LEHYRIHKESIPYISFPVLGDIDWICHGFSTRYGGVSTGIHSTMNLGFQNGDKTDAVYENYNRICNAIGVLPESIVHAKQTHKDNVRVVTYDDIGKGYNRERDYDDIDGLITNQAGITLTILTADCVPVYLVDPVNRAIGLAHSGWRGTIQRIASKTVNCMQQTFGSKPADILAVTGPCIGVECYEVGDEVASCFATEFSLDIYSKITLVQNNRTHINLSETIKYSLIETGVSAENILQCGLCTACNSEMLFSHRITQGKRGTMAAFLAIKP